MTKTAELWFPPLDQTAKVATDVIPSGALLSENGGRHVDALETVYETPCDIVLVAVPAGEGVTVEAAIRRALHVEAS